MSAASQRKVVEAARRLGYEPTDPRMQRRVYPERGELMFLIDARIHNGPAHPYFGRILNGAMREATERGGHVVCATFDGERDYLMNPGEGPAWLRDGKVSRCILTGGVNYSLVMAALQAGASVVSCSRPVPLDGVISVLPDYRAAGRMAVEHLVKLGHRRIAFLGEMYFQPGTYHRVEMMRGAAEAMEAAGLPAPGEVDLMLPKVVFEWAEPLRALMARKDRPTAIFALDDWTAALVIQALQELGHAVPKDVSVMGCNDENRSLVQRPELATVRFPLEEMGARAASLVTTEADDTRPHRLEVLPVELVPRESCGRPPRGL